MVYVLLVMEGVLPQPEDGSAAAGPNRERVDRTAHRNIRMVRMDRLAEMMLVILICRRLQTLVQVVMRRRFTTQYK
jgi:hypothetical protein